ncbi:hypothetical protein [Hymenobacter ruricola]|uniref:Uncharacterized protein n=1 Tax=Hymenobacter ruricola TaxID=2791023 RepID=A0ABS0IAN0_9BACT|nr:hypothetical protein [Hymenobacter ruricola]MBF9224018.1 hypothetical protein [Hymenobacter ruricola]
MPKKNRYLKVWSVLLILGATLYSCSKVDVERAATKTIGIEEFRSTFYSKGYHKALIQPFGDTAEIYWFPGWGRSYKKSKGNYQYTFVPLSLKLRSNKNLKWRDDVQLLGTNKFLLIKEGTGEPDFIIATYNSTVKDRAKLLDAFNHPAQAPPSCSGTSLHRHPDA